MKAKAFEVRDSGTLMPVVAILLCPVNESEQFLIRHSGFGPDNQYVLLTPIAIYPGQMEYDPIIWQRNGTRTLAVAHQYIAEHFYELEPGAVIDVEFILGETAQQKVSEMEPT